MCSNSPSLEARAGRACISAYLIHTVRVQLGSNWDIEEQDSSDMHNRRNETLRERYR